jgi:hypothetical protein
LANVKLDIKASLDPTTGHAVRGQSNEDLIVAGADLTKNDDASWHSSDASILREYYLD